MGSKAEILQSLRLLPQIKKFDEEKRAYEAPGLSFRIPNGTVAELCGSAPTEFIVEFLVLNRHFAVFWCEQTQRVFPPSIAQRGFDVTGITFGTYGRNLTDGVQDLLKNRLYDVIVTPNMFTGITLDRFGRSARDARTILLMLALEKPSKSIHIDLQLEIHRGPSEGSFRHEVLKLKHGRI